MPTGYRRNLDELKEKYGHLVLSWDGYETMETKLPCKCQECGIIVPKSIEKIICHGGVFCKPCASKIGGRKIRKMINKENYPMVTPEGWKIYKNTSTLLPCICEGCGCIVKKSINQLDRKSFSCTSCGFKKSSEKQRRIINKEDYPMVTPEGWEIYKNTHTKLPCICQGCGKIIPKTIHMLDKRKDCFCHRCSIDIKVKNTSFKKFGVDNVAKLPEVIEKRNNTKRKNNTFHTSKPEEECYQLLFQLYGESDVKRQYNKDSRYPFCADFYIISKDLFIECNFHKFTHGSEPFNPQNEKHINILDEWNKKNTSYYKNAIDVWTVRDPLKFKTAFDNNLNYLSFYSMKDFSDWYNKQK